MTSTSASSEMPGERGSPAVVAHQKRRIGELRRHLICDAFGLRENPFGVTPNPKYLYESRTHREARSSLIIGVECGMGFQAMIAPPGMGKTTILFQLLEQFQDVARTAFLFQLQTTAAGFLASLVSELDGSRITPDLHNAQDTINQVLLKQFRERRPVIVVVDEAQNLSTEVLETLRMLSNFETASEKLLHIILAGQPQLAERFSSPELAQLRQRISIFSTLVPFGIQDTSSYIAHRLQAAGYSGQALFTPEAVKAIWRETGGIPRNINMLCFNALLAASSSQRQIDYEIIAEVIADRSLRPVGAKTAPQQNVAVATTSCEVSACEDSPFTVPQSSVADVTTDMQGSSEHGESTASAPAAYKVSTPLQQISDLVSSAESMSSRLGLATCKSRLTVTEATEVPTTAVITYPEAQPRRQSILVACCAAIMLIAGVLALGTARRDALKTNQPGAATPRALPEGSEPPSRHSSFRPTAPGFRSESAGRTQVNRALPYSIFYQHYAHA